MMTDPSRKELEELRAVLENDEWAVYVDPFSEWLAENVEVIARAEARTEAMLPITPESTPFMDLLTQKKAK